MFWTAPILVFHIGIYVACDFAPKHVNYWCSGQARVRSFAPENLSGVFICPYIPLPRTPSPMTRPGDVTGAFLFALVNSGVSDESTQRLSVPGRNGGTLYPFRKGDPRRYNRTGNHGASVTQWRNALSNKPPRLIRRVAESDRYPAAMVQAAQELMQGIRGNLAAIAQSCDYTGNKPAQTTINQSTIDAYVRMDPQVHVGLPDALARRIADLAGGN